MKYLLDPSFEFNNKLITHLESKEGDKRILVYPVARGLRMRNMVDTMRVCIEVSGVLARVEFTEVVPDDGFNTPYMKNASFAVTDTAVIAEQLMGFFEGKWEIAKDD